MYPMDECSRRAMLKPSIQLTMSERAFARMSYRCGKTNSTFNFLQKLSIAELSQQFPLRLMDWII